ncbi:LysR family transcriptional regulator [Paracidovorax avenae]|uniref:Transcriptional regulator, LysR family n=3 Tax=Paracidovorax TaxID=3051137 RepID=F0Q3L0_PARA1|nr:LysR family transcriptional regulator [Paracidovorax avenae]ADX44252.1 transcriptional regulator, LysR family [Paracidovorax avenae ATCC 19860]AVT01211.1 LysR family transcriptional regulator [Paracidovorax avenae]AVT14968.1 LysR family transcriptional regulator [Paracidovorax avenae]
MDLSALEIFRAVAAEGSVTRAAERLGRVQSNVTTRVQQLEEQLGATLFLREGRRMALTPAGTSLVAYADRLLALAEEARQALHPGTPVGRLRLGAMESTAAARLPAPLARLHARWPGLQLELRTGASRDLVDQVLAHASDCALVAWPPPGVDPEAPVDCTPVFTESLVVALPAGHPPVARPGDLQVDTLAAFGPGCTYRRMGEDWMRAQRHGAAPQVLELASYHAILACVAAGRCAGVVPQSVIDLMREPPALRWVPLPDRETVLVRRRGWHTPALDALLDALRGAPASTSPDA